MNNKWYKIRKNKYSKETIREWNEWLKNAGEFAEKHTKETKKVYEVNGYYIECIQRKYDACMKKENEYGIRVWEQNPETVKTCETCLTNDWFNNANEANEHFKAVKEML